MAKTKTCVGPCGAEKSENEFRAGRNVCKVCRNSMDSLRKGYGSMRIGNPDDTRYAKLPPRMKIPDTRWPSVEAFDAGAEEIQVDPGFLIKGKSVLYDSEGNIKAQWIKTKVAEQNKVNILLEAMSHIADKWQGKSDPIKAPKGDLSDDLLAVYNIGDAHIGMLSWAPETGTNFNLQIAEHNLCEAVDKLVEMGPKSRQALIINIGDWFHADNKSSTTTAGTHVDTDSRFAKMILVGVRIMRRLIDITLTKHEIVHVYNAQGNHDGNTSIMLALCLSQYYEREPRVVIEMTPSKFHYHRFGLNLIGITHCDTVKMEALAEIMACDRPEDWGQTVHRWFVTGHIHHTVIKELRGCTVESLRTLAPADAWHKGQGYRSKRDMKVVILHKEHGEIQRHTVGISQIELRG